MKYIARFWTKDNPMADEQGGTDWELSEAIRLMGEAQASGNPEQIATAMRRHAEALTNSANTTLIPTLRSVLETVVRSEVNKIHDRLDNHNRADLDWRTEERRRRDDQSDYLYKELDGLKTDIPATVGGVVASELKKVLPRIEGLESGQKAHAGQINALGETLDTVHGDVDMLKVDVGELKQGFKLLRAEVSEVKRIVRSIAEVTGVTRATKEMLKRWEENNPPPDDNA